MNQMTTVLCLAIAMTISSIGIAQQDENPNSLAVQNGPAAAHESEPQQDFEEPQESAPQPGEPEFAVTNLFWESLDTHLEARVEISGKEFSWKKNFTDGTAPEFNSLSEELEPGIYSYQVTYTPNELAEARQKMRSKAAQVHDLASQIDKAIESGDSDVVKNLYRQSRDTRQKLVDLQSKQRQKTRKEHDLIEQRGHFIVDESGLIEKYDRNQARKERRQQLLEERKLNLPQSEEDKKARRDH